MERDWGNYKHINKIKPRSSEQGAWSPQTPARYITLHYIKQEGHKIALHYAKADFTGIGWTGLAPYKLPRALDSLLIYQQPSSTTLYYSYLGMFT